MFSALKKPIIMINFYLLIHYQYQKVDQQPAHFVTPNKSDLIMNIRALGKDYQIPTAFAQGVNLLSD